ncbi:MAG: GNAT family N-acetyltransferase [Leptospiraceae bacterium]|nr:GNAT family N-acetyltransferase [Leptospiraceae bacterium]
MLTEIRYHKNRNISSNEFIDVLERSGLAERRPVSNLIAIEKMLQNANLIISAWKNEKLIGISRCVTDFSYCCYLSDLAVDKDLQSKGVGKELIQKTMDELDDTCKIILIAAPKARDYYPKLGFTYHDSAWYKWKKQP